MLAECSQKMLEKSPDKHAPDPVLVTMGNEGRDRALWEYYKACVTKRRAFGQRAHMPLDSKLYIVQFFSAMKLGLAVEEQRRCKHLQTAKKLRDFVVAWCHFYAHTKVPFQGIGNKKDWNSVQWEQLPMHELVIDAESNLSDGSTAVSDGGGEISEHDNQPEDQEMEGGDADSDAHEDSCHAAGDERAFARMPLAR
jgi:hypothetical protein